MIDLTPPSQDNSPLCNVPRLLMRGLRSSRPTRSFRHSHMPSLQQAGPSPRVLGPGLFCFSEVQGTHVGHAHLPQNIRQGLVVLISTNKHEGRAVGDLGSKGQNEESLALALLSKPGKHMQASSVQVWGFNR